MRRAKALPATFAMAATATAAAIAYAHPARAADAEDAAFTRGAERRAGFVLGLNATYGVASASGYPNEASKIGDPVYLAQTGPGVGGGFTVLVMGALTDYVSFGIWFGGQRAQSADWKSTAGGGGFRVEAFPLYGLVPALRDLGVAATLGLGSARIEATRGPYPGADGVQSFVGASVFHEWRMLNVLGGHLAGGPSLEVAAVFSRAVERQSVSLGGRLVFYTGR